MSRLMDVIIPMYNRADCVPNIISELEKQTFKEFRAIFVDDGSKDNTYETLENELKKADFEYLLIKKENGGAGSARNAGMRAADAEWLACIDSDDGLKPTYLEYLYTAASESNSDMAICNLKMYYEGQKAYVEPVRELKYELISAADAMKIYCRKWLGAYCLLIKREIQQRDNLYYDEECIYNEDAAFIPKVIAAAQRVAYIEEELYLYYTHVGSLHRSPRLDKFYSAIKSFMDTEDYLLNYNSEAADVFNTVGSVRFYIATLRRAAVQMPYKYFLDLEKKVCFKRYKQQIKNLIPAQRMACYLLLCSKFVFYYSMRILFKD